MIVEDVELWHELVEQGSALSVGGCFPDGIEVESPEDIEDLVESCSQVGSLHGVCLVVRSERDDLGVQALFFGLESFGADLVAVVELEQLGALLFEFSDLRVPVSLTPTGGLAAGGPAFQARSDRSFKFGVIPNESNAEHGSTQQSLVRVPGNLTAFASVPAAVAHPSSAVVHD